MAEIARIKIAKYFNTGNDNQQVNIAGKNLYFSASEGSIPSVNYDYLEIAPNGDSWNITLVTATPLDAPGEEVWITWHVDGVTFRDYIAETENNTHTGWYRRTGTMSSEYTLPCYFEYYKVDKVSKMASTTAYFYINAAGGWCRGKAANLVVPRVAGSSASSVRVYNDNDIAVHCINKERTVDVQIPASMDRWIDVTTGAILYFTNNSGSCSDTVEV